MNINFLIVEDVINPTIGLDAMEFSFIYSTAEKHFLSSMVKEQSFITFGITTILQECLFKGFS